MGRLQIRLLKTHQEFRACERIQEVVWGHAGVSGELMNVTQKYGGAILGAFVKGRVAGFIYAFLARRHGKLIHWSHLMAVEPKFRDLGLGFRMKLAHRKIALAGGVSAICWTYDPLQSRNATLNIGRLGARVAEYLPNCYGRFQSVIEKGLESDRFVVDWRIRNAAVERRLRDDRARETQLASVLNAERINETCLNAQGFPENHRVRLNLSRPVLLVEIPAETDRMRRQSLNLARRWRLQTRKIFERYFKLGYRAEDFIPPSTASNGCCFYVLRRVRKTTA